MINIFQCYGIPLLIHKSIHPYFIIPEGVKHKIQKDHPVNDYYDQYICLFFSNVTKYFHKKVCKQIILAVFFLPFMFNSNIPYLTICIFLVFLTPFCVIKRKK